MPILLLARHGETDWNRSGQIMGDRPIPLNPNGQDQARRLATVLPRHSIVALYCSPVVRARQTADILASALELPVITDPGLTEINGGEWVGRFWKDLADEFARQNFYSSPDEARPPGGETLREVQVRAISFTERALAERAELGETAGPLLFVSHADVVRAIIAHYLSLDLRMIRQARIDHASLTALTVGDGYAELLFLNHTADLQGLKEQVKS